MFECYWEKYEEKKDAVTNEIVKIEDRETEMNENINKMDRWNGY